MIYCVRFEDVASHLHATGYREVARTERTVLFVRADGVRLLVRAPNVDGNVPESLVLDAFETAGLQPPDIRTFWCD